MQGCRFLLALCVLIYSSVTFALEDKTFCVWDPVGRSGPVMTFYSDVIPRAQTWGLNIKFNAYTEETDAVADFKAGKCDAAVLTSILSRQFVKFAGTMDAIGAINSEKGLELAIATLARSRAGNLMIEDEYEVVTTFPVGSMYAFVRDRSVDTIDDFAGKTIAVLNGDPQMKKFADLAGASPVNVRLSNFDDKFNSGELDILVMPALAYNTFELYKGLGTKGGIIDYRLYYGMLQTITKHARFPEGFGDKMRNYMLTRLKAMNKMVRDAEDEIPSHYWIKTNQFVKDDIDFFSKRVRLALRDDDVNNPAALKLFWKIRCRLDPSRGECKEFPEAPSQAKIAKKKSSAKHKAQAKKQKQIKQASKQKVANKQKAEQALKQAQLQLKAEKEKLAAEKQELNSIRNKIDAEKAQLEQFKKELEAQQQKLEEEKRLFEQAKLDKKNKLEALALSAAHQNPRDVSEDQDQAFDVVASDEAAKGLDKSAIEATAFDDEADEKTIVTDIAKVDEVMPEAVAENAEEQEESRSIWQFLFGWIWS